jgi:hypothetical protein
VCEVFCYDICMALFKKPSWLWRAVTDFWTILAFAVIIEDFRRGGDLGHIIDPVMAIYIVVLAIFSAEKEFERWYTFNVGRHIGEIYVFVWTVIIAGIFCATYLTHSHYEMPEEVFSTYLVVLGILAITRKSKEFFKEKKKRVEI